MRSAILAISLLITLTLVLALNIKIGDIPPLGKLLSPFHGFWVNAENEALQLPQSLSIQGLKAEVTVYYDDMYVPHIYAQNDHDVYMAQGYVTARDRLWQMELSVRKTAGRLSEVLGPNLLEIDRIQRRRGLGYGAKRAQEALKKEQPSVYATILAYTKGINAYIDQLTYKDLPIEYKLLDYKPEPWTDFKCFLFLREMADKLSRDNQDLAHTNITHIWGKDTLDLLYPEMPTDLDPIIPSGTKWDFTPVPIPQPPANYPEKGLIKGNVTAKKNIIGSNNFAVSGAKSTTGHALLANEPDLELSLPSIWYVVHLNTPEMNVMGASLPGTPHVIIGFNDDIAWGVTNAKRDLVDWYTIKFRDDTRKEYAYDGKWLKTQMVIEPFEIRGQEDFYDTLIYTHLGPLTYDRNFQLDDNKEMNLAMKWAAHEPSLEPVAFYQLNRAKDYDEYVTATSFYSTPPQNFIFGSVTGDIAMRISGKFPVKWSEQGKFVLDGSNVAHEWQDWIPQNHNYVVKNPERQFVSSANQHPGDSLYPYYDWDYNFEHYRGRRINDRLRSLKQVSVEEMMGLQQDNFNYMAYESLPTFLAQVDTIGLKPEEERYLTTLKNWDYFNEPELTAPTFYEIWFDLFYGMTWDEFEQQPYQLYLPDYYRTIELMKIRPDLPFFDIQKTTDTVENASHLIQLSFKDAVDSLDRWRQANGENTAWYRYKNSSVRHLLRLPAFSRDQIKIGGNHNIVNAASGTVGPSWRMVVELDPAGIKAWGIYPGSQTGNPGNPTYAEMIEAWASGDYRELLFQPNVANHERIVHKLTLQPQ